MATQRLINCDFFLKGAFDGFSSNKAKLLYFYFFINADDYGFVGNANKVIKDLNEEENDTNALIDYNYFQAADELVEKGLLFRFLDRHQNQILLIRHFFIHNKYNPRFMTTNYYTLKKQIELVDGCWEMKKKPLKENKESNESKVNNINNKEEKEESVIVEKVENDNEEDDDEEMSWDEIMSTLGNNNGDKETESNDSEEQPIEEPKSEIIENASNMTFSEILEKM